jgi:hypothetical protein
MELSIAFDPNEGATHRIRWDVVGSAGDQLSPDVGAASTARLGSGDDVDGAVGWRLRSEVASPIAERFSADGVVVVVAYAPHDYGSMLEFDRRITQRYTEFCASTGEFYAGTVACSSWEPGWLGEVVWFDVPTIELADAVGTDVAVPEDVQAIVAECSDRQDRARTRHTIYFEPFPVAR